MAPLFSLKVSPVERQYDVVERAWVEIKQDCLNPSSVNEFSDFWHIFKSLILSFIVYQVEIVSPTLKGC